MKQFVLSVAAAAASLSFCPSALADSAQPRAPMAKNAVYLEGLGPGIFYSLNYERIIADVIAPRVGFSVLSVSASSGNSTASASQFTIPITVSYVGLRQGMHGFEAGGGATFIFATGNAVSAGTTSSNSSYATGATGFAGYRLHPVDGVGFQFRVGLGIQAIFAGNATVVLPWPYLSVGGAF